MSKSFFKKYSIIALLLALLVISTYAADKAASQDASQDADLSAEWPCGHDHQEKKPLEFLDVEESNFKEAQAGERILTGYPNMRMYGYYGLVEAAGSGYYNYVSQQLVPPILSYFEAALKVKYPVSGLLSHPGSSVCGFSNPAFLRSGVNADYVYFIEISSAGGNWVAMSQACAMATGSKRPLIGYTQLNRDLLKIPGSNVLLHERNMICTMHEVIHTLGFSAQLYPYFVDANGHTLESRHVISTSLDGKACQVIDVNPLTSMLQSFFGCSSLMGAYMENSGSDATAGSHFERRQFTFEILTSGLIYQMQLSKFSLGMLEGSGWYVPDYTYADPFFFGQGEGCNFLLQTCTPSMQAQFADFCTSGTGCTSPGRGGGVCAADNRSDNCKFFYPEINMDCENSATASSSRLPSIQTFGRGSGAKCFEGTLGSGRAEGLTTFCFRHTCTGSGSNVVLNVDVGSQTVACTARGPKTVAGLAGALECPDPAEYCATVGAKSCPRNCMGRGTCVNGGCSCYSGFSGTDCALNA